MNRESVDKVTLGLWRILASVAGIAARLLVAALVLLYSIADRLLDAIPVRRRGATWNFFDRLLEIPAEVADSSVAEETAEIANSMTGKFSRAMEKSGNFRLAVLALLAMITILGAYPPSHWGPWNFYQKGIASYYDDGLAGKKTASGERYDPANLTAAHRTLPLGVIVKVERPRTGKTVYARINDRGPHVKGRIIDLSRAAAEKLGIDNKGTAEVAIYIR